MDFRRRGAGVLAGKVLICDDEPHIRESLRFIVESEGYEVVLACDGAEGLEAARVELPQVALLDITMPELDGYAVCRGIREHPGTRHTYVVMLTARSQDEDRDQAMSVGADEYITKPFSPTRLKRLLRRVLSADGKEQVGGSAQV